MVGKGTLSRDLSRSPRHRLWVWRLGLAILMLSLAVTISDQAGSAAITDPIDEQPVLLAGPPVGVVGETQNNTARMDSPAITMCGRDLSECGDGSNEYPVSAALPATAVDVPDSTEDWRSQSQGAAVTLKETTTTTAVVETTTTTQPISSVSGSLLLVGPAEDYPTLQAALDAAYPGAVIRLAVPGPHPGPVKSVRDGTVDAPITIDAVGGAWLECDSGRCFQLSHSSYRIENFSIVGGTSNLYIVGASPGSFVSDVEIMRSTFRGSPAGGTGECIRVKYQASGIRIGYNNIADCGLESGGSGSKNGEGIYIGTAPEQLHKNPSPEPDRTNGVWVHDNVIRSWNECVDVKEASYDNLIEHNSCSGQADEKSGAFGSRGGRPGEGNVFRFNLIDGARGSCIRFGGDEDPDGTGNQFYGNLCRDIAGEYGIKQVREPQGIVCEIIFSGAAPAKRLSLSTAVDVTADCPNGVPSSPSPPGARLG